MSSYKVAVIVRTKNRPLFLKRALEGLQKQSFQDFRVHLINDGGDPVAVRECIAAQASWWGERLSCVDLPYSVGRGKALALAFAASDEPYILIHDDDDTLEPAFLAETVAYLERDEARFFAGVVTSNYDVYEHVEGQHIIIDTKTDHYGQRHGSLLDYSLYLSHLCVVMPIAFLFRRTALAEAGGVNAELQYVEDHDLFIRIMLAGEVGVIPAVLCSRHHRNKVGDASDASKHEVAYDYVLAYENEMIRKAIRGGGRFEQMQAHVIQSSHQERFLLGQLSQQVAQLQEGFGSLTQLLGEMLGRLGR